VATTPFYAYGKRGYLAVVKETTAGTAVKPTNYGYFDAESIVTGYESDVLGPAANTRSKNYFMVPGKNAAPAGQLSMQMQPAILGHFLSGCFGSPSTSGPTDTAAYTHTFASTASGSIPTYTLDIGNTDSTYVKRYVGCQFGNYKPYIKGNVWMTDFSVMARYSFTKAKVATTASSGTTLVLDSNHGLTTSDTIYVSFKDSTNQAEYTIAAVNTNGTTLTLGSAITGVTHTAGDLVVIKKSTPSYSSASPYMQWMGGTTTSIGTTVSGASAVQRLEDFTIDFNQDLEARYAPNGTGDFSRFPATILVKGYGATMTTKFYHQDLTYLSYLRDRQDIAFVVTTSGNLISGAATTKDSVTHKIAAARINPYDVNLGSDGIIEEAITAVCATSTSDGYDVQVVLVNGTSAY